jgi:MFS family permease
VRAVRLIRPRANTAPAISPLIGALLLYYKNWTAIFWFLAVFSGVCLCLIFFVLPETARNIVGDGSLKPPWTSRTPFLSNTYRDRSALSEKRRSRPVVNPLSCLVLLWDYCNAIVISSQSVCYMTLTCLQASLSSICFQIYRLNKLQLGLIYIPFGVGCAISAFGTGNVQSRYCVLPCRS